MEDIVIDPQTLCPRRAYEVSRYHTWPHLQRQTVGEHSAQVWRILKAIWPDCPARLLDHCMTHDMGEGVSGDVPYPVKRSSPAVKRGLDELEMAAHLRMSVSWMVPEPSAIDNFERMVFKLAEYIEMWEFGLSELTLGNRAARLIAQRMRAEVNSSQIELLQSNREEAQFISNRVMVYTIQRENYYTLVNEEEAP